MTDSFQNFDTSRSEEIDRAKKAVIASRHSSRFIAGFARGGGATQADEHVPFLAFALNIEYVSRLGTRKHHALRCVRTSNLHGGNFPLDGMSANGG
ncbi:MAG: hypothetical protein OXF43_03135 [Gammaproteobacteria bacterium]|nr:hypothetical protein [Gammaproteobacteria bacterium]